MTAMGDYVVASDVVSEFTMSQPPLVLVHGAWHGSWAWDALLPHLEGRHVVAVDLTSSGPDAASLGDLAADAQTVRDVLDGLDEPAVVVGHSYGGMVITEATAGRDDVRHLVYVTAFMLDEGESLVQALAGELPPWIEIVAEGMASIPLTPIEAFYADADERDATAAAKRLQLQSTASFSDGLTAVGWKEIPSTYVVCEQDNAIPPVAQEGMAQRAGNVHRMATSHSPFMSRPEDLAPILLGV